MLGMAAVAVLIATIAYNATRKYPYHIEYILLLCEKLNITISAVFKIIPPVMYLLINTWIYKDQMKVVLWINILGLYFYTISFEELTVISGLMILLLLL